MLSQRNVSLVRDKFPPGARLVVEQMIDPYHPIPSGTRGTVVVVDDAGQIHCQYDNGRSGVALVPTVDAFRALTKEELAEEVSGRG